MLSHFGSRMSLGLLAGIGLTIGVVAYGCSAGGGTPINKNDSGIGGSGGGVLPDDSSTGGDEQIIGDTGNPDNYADDGCAAESHVGVVAQLDIYMMIDKSASMSDPDAGDPWPQLQAAVVAFVSSPDSVGLGVGMNFLPTPASQPIPQNCTTNAQCGLYGPCMAGFNMCTGYLSKPDSCVAGDYQNQPAVPIANLPGNQQAMVDKINGTDADGNSTPTEPAVSGALAYMKAWATQYPTHLPYFLLATDGEPNNCDPNTTNNIAYISGEVQTAATTSPQVKTFVIGVGSNLTDLNQIAAAGGTGSAYFVDTGGDVTQQLINMLNSIRESAGCMYTIPVPTSGQPDYTKVNVQFVPGAGDGGTTDAGDQDASLADVTVTDTVFTPDAGPFYIPYVGDLADCDPVNGGWYYDDPTTPTKIILCPASCNYVRLHTGTVNVVLGCKTIGPK